jgi:hypothetical protein
MLRIYDGDQLLRSARVRLSTARDRAAVNSAAQRI